MIPTAVEATVTAGGRVTAREIELDRPTDAGNEAETGNAIETTVEGEKTPAAQAVAKVQLTLARAEATMRLARRSHLSWMVKR